MTIENDVQQTWHDAIVEMYELDISTIVSGGDTSFYFTAETMRDDTKIQWRRSDSDASLVTYEPLPIQATGFDKTTKGQIPTPELTVSNIFGTFSEVIDDLDDLVGAKVYRRRTLYKYLPGGGATNLNSYFPTDLFYIERKTAETNLYVTFQLASPIDLEGLRLPKRVITQNYCVWKYRGAECGYTGGPVADAFDRPTSDPNVDQCGKQVSSCRLRFSGQLPFGGFPGANLTR
jgi:lambda family phage minor tail protein L